jgi:hypothetical protein
MHSQKYTDIDSFCQSIIDMNSNVPSGYSKIPIVSNVLPGNGFFLGCSVSLITNTFFLYVSVILIIVPLKPLKLNLLPSLKYDAMILLYCGCSLNRFQACQIIEYQMNPTLLASINECMPIASIYQIKITIAWY